MKDSRDPSVKQVKFHTNQTQATLASQAILNLHSEPVSKKTSKNNVASVRKSGRAEFRPVIYNTAEIVQMVLKLAEQKARMEVSMIQA